VDGVAIERRVSDLLAEAVETLKENNMFLTLDPAPGVDPLDLPRNTSRGGGHDSRHVLVFAEPVELEMWWTSATLTDGRTVEVRRADCGLGCFCAGEFRWSAK
jgi:hypothetical protein